MKQRVAVETEIDTDGQWCGQCRFRSYREMYGTGSIRLLYGNCHLERVDQVDERDGKRWLYYEERRCDACLADTNEHVLMTHSQCDEEIPLSHCYTNQDSSVE